jgi:hypothetical protein
LSRGNTLGVIHIGQFSDFVDSFKDSGVAEEVELGVKMYCLAEKHVVPDLRETARSCYCESLLKFAGDLESHNQFVICTFFTSNLICTVYDSPLPEKDRNLKDPLLILILGPLRSSQHTDPAAYEKMIAEASSDFTYDVVMRRLRPERWLYGKFNKDVDELNVYSIYAQKTCDKQQYWTQDMKETQCYQCRFSGFVSSGHSSWYMIFDE